MAGNDVVLIYIGDGVMKVVNVIEVLDVMDVMTVIKV